MALYGNPLLTAAEIFDYQGAFRAVYYGADAYQGTYYSSNKIAYNPVNNSIFLSGADGGSNNTQGDKVGEFAIPGLLTGVAATALNNVSVLQDMVQPFSGLTIPTGAIGNEISSMHVEGGKLYVNRVEAYDATSPFQPETTAVVEDASDLAGSAVSGWYELQGKAFTVNYWSALPAEWATEFGHSHLCGSGGGRTRPAHLLRARGVQKQQLQDQVI